MSDVGNVEAADFAATLDKRQNNRFLGDAVLSVLGTSADVAFITLDDLVLPPERTKTAFAHCLHECGGS